MLNPEKAKMALHVSNTIARYRKIGSLKWPTNMQAAPPASIPPMMQWKIPSNLNVPRSSSLGGLAAA
jgi:hypothetical protein